MYLNDDKIYTEPFFDLKIDAKDGMPYVILEKSWEHTIISLIDFYLYRSPERMIGVLFRLGHRVKSVYKEFRIGMNSLMLYVKEESNLIKHILLVLLLNFNNFPLNYIRAKKICGVERKATE